MATRINLREPVPLRWNAKPIAYEIDERGCWICTSHSPAGYRYPKVGRGARKYSVHRYVYELLVKPIEEGMNLCHRCDNTLCINPSHMFEGTQQDNMEDMVSKGRHGGCVGELHPSVRLRESDVLQVRAWYPLLSVSQNELARLFGVSRSCIKQVVQGRTWRHV